MIAKIGFVVLVLISSGTLYLLDYILKQDQDENSKQLHSFVKQTREEAEAKVAAKEKFEMQLMTDLAHCQENAKKRNDDYLSLIQKAAPRKHGELIISSDILNDAALFLTNEKADCKKTYDDRLREGI